MGVIEFAKAYRDLGQAVQEQLDDVLDGRPERCNPAAIVMMREAFKEFGHSGIDEIEDIVAAVNWAYNKGRE